MFPVEQYISFFVARDTSIYKQVKRPTLDSLDNRTSEQVEITGSRMDDFTIVRRLTVGVEDKIQTHLGQTILHDSD